MSRIILKETELVKLLETAMDIYIYNKPVDYDTTNNDKSSINNLENIVEILKELIYMLESGKEIDYSLRGDLFSEFDRIKNIFDRIKYKNHSH